MIVAAVAAAARDDNATRHQGRYEQAGTDDYDADELTHGRASIFYVAVGRVQGNKARMSLTELLHLLVTPPGRKFNPTRHRTCGLSGSKRAG